MRYSIRLNQKQQCPFSTATTHNEFCQIVKVQARQKANGEERVPTGTETARGRDDGQGVGDDDSGGGGNRAPTPEKRGEKLIRGLALMLLARCDVPAATKLDSVMKPTQYKIDLSLALSHN
uniref:Uncharacterized protein n=1 Tax=Plectus sambesii TaxID=2011161 RepID=A0A914XHE6_9BILA